MVVTLAGIVIATNEVHRANVPDEIVVKLSDKETDVKAVHRLNAESPIVITLFGIMTVVNFEHSEKVK